MDANTLLIINVSVATTLAIIMLGLYWTNRQETSLVHWALAAAGFWGNSLINLVYNPVATPYWLGPPLGNLLLVSSYLFLLSGLCHYLKKPLPLLLIIGMLSLVYLVNFSDYARASAINRTFICFPILITLSLYILYRLFSAKLKGMRIAIVLFAIFVGANLLQLTYRLAFFIHNELKVPPVDTPALIHDIGTLAILLFMLGTLTSCILLLVRQKTLQLRQLAHTDPLTGWLNRQSMQQRIDAEWHRCKRMQLPLSMLLFDIDYFKQVNDKYGHHTGDEVLQQTSAMAKALLRDYDLLFRIGGEEFLVCLPGVGAGELEQISERLRKQIASLHIAAQPDLQLTISVGCSTSDNTMHSWHPLLEHADKALYQAKQHGRNRVIHFTEDVVTI